MKRQQWNNQQKLQIVLEGLQGQMWDCCKTPRSKAFEPTLLELTERK